ncbi:winged helix-turn-helix domain-containing protein [Bacillus sp. FJAT-45350]|uniref:winged helix-turn-helix domain-containing protein n=1 Tax=Bacillus sp. FJAT-45350 TaxID=2011014 RepID=UPI0015CB9E4C|nr:winged helix-turn-helix domain-containing protein [Bacillus sp. FJAT-45350]
MNIQFHDHIYSVTYNGETISLLRKEYALLKYLYNHVNIYFTRGELLDAVWTLENPSDRTVDDHIYRLRKKLRPWQHTLKIETAKGFGYRFTVKTPVEEPSPFVNDKEFKDLAAHLLAKYHLYGQGEALKTIIQQKSLGIEADKSFQISLFLNQGDIWRFVKTDDISFSEKVLILFYLYMLVEEKRGKVLPFYEKALQKNLFSEETCDEAFLLAPIYFAMFSREYKKAAEYLEQSERIVTSKEHGFYSFLRLSGLMLSLCAGEHKRVMERIEEMENFFLKKPYQREMGLFYILKGLFAIQMGDKKRGRKDIDQGMEIIRKTRFMSHVFLGLNTCLFFFQYHIDDPLTYDMIKKEWKVLAKEYHFEKLKQEIEAQLRYNL